MRSDLPKVLHKAAGRPLVSWVLAAVEEAGVDHRVLVLGHEADQVAAEVGNGIDWVLQEPQNGTGHAVAVALEHLGLPSPDSTVIVGYGDMPLVPAEVYRHLAERPSDVAAMITTVDPGPAGFGRIIRNGDGAVTGIVEERDCTVDQVAVTERNAGIYSFDGRLLADAIARIKPDNDQGELYLTDVIGLLVADGHRIETLDVPGEDVVGINSQDQLAEVQAILRRRINHRLMGEGVWMLDPERTYVDATVRVAAGAHLYPGTHLEGETAVGSGAVVGPDAFVVDSTIGEGATVSYSVLRGAEVGDSVSVGPYASLRPGTVLKRGSKAGTFVETKNTTVGEGAKVPHLSYMGDATIGEGANVGAGTITFNYDGTDKHPTVIGAGAFIGSDTMLVAPVTIGDGATTGAGSVISKDVEAGALAVERSPQVAIPNYAERRAARRRGKDSSKGN